MKREENACGDMIREAQRLARAGRCGQALDFCGEAVFLSGDAGLMEPAKRWLRDRAFVESAGEEAVCVFVVRVVSALDGCAPKEREQLQNACLEALGAFDPAGCPARQDTTDRYVAECILLRHMGRQEEALRTARQGLAHHGTAYCATFAGLCCLALGDEEGAEEAIRQGARVDPGCVTGYNDLGDYYFDRESYEKAEEAYCHVLDSGDQADCGWAEPSALFCRWMREKDPADLERLALCAAADPDNSRAAGLCGLVRAMLQTPYVDYLPRSTEALVNCLRQMEERGGDVQEAKISLTCQEAASCVNALRLHMSSFGARKARLTLVVERAPNPPLDAPASPDGARLWRYGPDFDAEPAVEPPDRDVVERVARLAREPFDLAAWYGKAGPLAEGLDGADAQSLYGCMVYPPLPEIQASADVWLTRVQYAAVCILARMGGGHLEAASQQMREYVKKLPSPELARICLGQLDWPVIPALTLLAWQAREGVADRDAAAELLFGLLKRVPRHDFCFFEHALVCAMSWMPGLSDEIHDEMRLRRKRLEEE